MCARLARQAFAREVDMYRPLLNLFPDVSFVAAEVPFFGKRIDLIFGSPGLLSLYAVETKLHDWRSAFKQAALNQLASQRSYVAVPWSLAMRLVDKEEDLFRRYDVGLIGVNESAKVLVLPRRNGCFSIRHYRVLKQTLNKRKFTKPKRLGDVADAIANRRQALVLLQTRID